MWYKMFFLLTFAGLTICTTRADEPDPITWGVDKARAESLAALAAADMELADSFNAIITRVAGTGDLDAVKRLLAEKDAFEDDGRMPTLREMKTAVARYQQAMRKSRDALALAYNTAVREYTKELQFDKAEALRSELDAFKAAIDKTTPPKPAAEKSATIEIHAAFYGQNISWIDVTEKMRAVVKDAEKRTILVDTRDWGEPAPAVPPGWRLALQGNGQMLVHRTILPSSCEEISRRTRVVGAMAWAANERRRKKLSHLAANG